MWASSFSPSGVRTTGAARASRTRALAQQAFGTVFQPPPGAGDRADGPELAPGIQELREARQGLGHPDAALPVVGALLAVDGVDALDPAVRTGGDLHADGLVSRLRHGHAAAGGEALHVLVVAGEHEPAVGLE